MDKVSLKIPNKPNFVSIARLTVSSLANDIGFDIDDIEDLKVAVGEAINNAILHGSQSNFLEIDFNVNKEEIRIEILDQGMGFDSNLYKKPNLDDYKGNGLGIFIMESLMDEVIIESQMGNGTKITLVKKVC
jgi:serine/threonine-protein kinase RsbW